MMHDEFDKIKKKHYTTQHTADLQLTLSILCWVLTCLITVKSGCSYPLCKGMHCAPKTQSTAISEVDVNIFSNWELYYILVTKINLHKVFWSNQKWLYKIISYALYKCVFVILFSLWGNTQLLEFRFSIDWLINWHLIDLPDEQLS